MMLLALVFTVLGATTATAQKIYKAELDKSMFQAWTSNEADATVVENPEPIDVSDENPNGTQFNCDFNLFKEVGSWSGIYGSSAAYYLWYADITGTKKMHFTGTPGFKFYVQFNRLAPVEGGDAHGGDMTQQELTIGTDGTLSYDVAALNLPYVHLNCIKTKGTDVTGALKSIIIEGTVKPVTGILSMINNGDAEGDDLASFPVSYDGPNNGEKADDLPEIVAGGVDGSKCFKVTSFPDPTETWHTQFYIKADEKMERGSKWKLIMYIKADRDTKITTSAQAQPRSWKGSMGIDEFQVGTEWKKFEWNGEIGVDDFQSIAFDLNNGDERNANDNGWLPGNGGATFYFDNIEFGYDLGGTNPMSQITANVCDGTDAVQINLNGLTNMKDLVKATGKDRIVYPNELASVTWNGVKCELASVEGREDGNLYLFLVYDDEGGTEFRTEGATIEVAFKNPADATQIKFTTGKWEGEAVPEFSKLVCVEDPSLDGYLSDNEYYSYIWGAPVVQSADPEEGSFNLPADTKQFKITFNQDVKVSSVEASIDGEKLVASVEGTAEFAKTITLNRTGNTALAGEKTLIISHAVGVQEDLAVLNEPIEIEYSFGPFAVDPNDQEETIYTSDFTSGEGDNANGAGWKVNSDSGGLQDANSGSGCRLMHNQGAFVDDLLYIAQRGTSTGGVAIYGIEDGYKLSLEAKPYNLSLNACRHDRTDVGLKVQVLPEDAVNTEDGTILDEDAILVEDFKEITPEKTSKEYIHFDIEFTPKVAGNYVIRVVPSKSNGSFAGYDDPVCFAEVIVKHEPSALGYKEIKLLTEALEKAKSTRDGNNGERYDGPAFTTLDEAIKKIEAEKDGYSAPSIYKNAAAELDADAQAMSDHRKLCDNYDTQIKASIDVERQNAEKKFATTDTYAQAKALNAKYHGSSEWKNMSEDPEIEDNQLIYTYDVLKDDAALNEAVNDLTASNNLATLSFTEGFSAPENAWGGKATGAAVFTDRIRQGVETLKALGVANDDALVVEGNNALTDDDALADAIKNRIKAEIYGQLKNADNTVFAPEVDDETLEETTKSYNMTVFVKNPNVYKQQTNMNFTEENVPGWVTPEGYNAPGLTVGWGSPKNVAGVAEDCMFQTWGAAYRAENIITDLPAGIYTLKAGFGERDTATLDETGVYVRTSATPEGEDYEQIAECPSIGQAFPNLNVELPDAFEVTDGFLVIGVNAQAGTHTFFNSVELTMVGAVSGFPYDKAYEEVMVGVEDAKTAKVRGLELYDLNGRRIITARKGLVIVKKYMSDGSVKTEKVIK